MFRLALWGSTPKPAEFVQFTKRQVFELRLACNLPERELARYVMLLGPVGLIFQKMDDLSRKKIIETIRTAFDPYVYGTEVRFTSACLLDGSRAGINRFTS